MALTFRPYIAVEVYEPDGLTLIAELPRRWNIQGSEPMNVPGVGQITLSLDDPVVGRHPEILDMNNWVKFYIGDGLGHGDYCHAFHVRQKNTKSRGQAEAADRLVTLSGPTPLALLDDFMIKHEVQPPRPDASESRSYTWTAPVGEWYDAADWAATIVSEGKWNDHVTNARSGTLAKPKYQPEGWPVSNAEWLRTSGGATWQFFRTYVDIPAGGLLVKLFATADETLRVFLDGDMVISRDEYENGYKSFSDYKTFLPEGRHYISIMMRKKGTPGGDGVDAFLFALCSLDGKGEPLATLRKSNDGGPWKAHNGLPVPGWKQAEILRSQVLEAQARGNESALMLTMDFTQSTSSAPESAAWVIEISKPMKIFTSILDSLQQLCEIGSFDVWVDPANFHLKAWLKRGLDMSDSITYESGRNLLDWDVTEKDEIKNTALIKYDGGWVEYNATASQAAHGHREIGISLGSIGDDDTAQTIAGSHVERRRHARKRGGAAPEIDKNEDDQPTAAIALSPGTVGGIDYRTGSYLKVPRGTGVKAKQRCMGLTFAEDNDTGQVTIDPEFNEED